MLEEPTAGVDVGAKAEIYGLLDAALARGLAHPGHRHGFRGGGPHLPPRPGLQPRRDRGRDRRRRALGRGASSRAASAGVARPGARRWRTHELDQVDRAGADRGRAARACRSASASPGWCPVYGLLILTVAADPAVLDPAAARPSRPCSICARSSSDKAIIALLSLAAMIPMMTGKIDLTVGYGIVLWHILAITLQIHVGLPWPVAVRRAWSWPALRSACSTASWSRSRGSTASSPRSAPARCIYAVALWYTGRPADDRQPAARLLPGEQRQPPRHADHRLLRAGHRAAAVDRHRVPADRPLPLRHRRQPPRRRAQRHPDAAAT